MRPRSVSRMPFGRGVTRLLTAFAALMGTVWPSSGSPSARVLSSMCFPTAASSGTRVPASNYLSGSPEQSWPGHCSPSLGSARSASPPSGLSLRRREGLEPAGRALSLALLVLLVWLAVLASGGASRLHRPGRVHGLHASVAPRAERARARDRARVLHGLVPGARNGPAADRGRAHPAAGRSGARHEPAAGARRASRCPPAHLIRRSRLVLKARSLTEHEPRPPCSVRAR